MLLTTSRLLTSVCALAATVSAVTPVVVDGKDFVNSKTKDRFQIIGVDYQPGDTGGFSKKEDPLSDPKACLRDAALLQRLGVNTIRIYNLSPHLEHDECVSIFNAADIYMILDVNSPLPGTNLDRTDPQGSYHEGYLKQVFGVMEEFKAYPNTLAFFAGNEVINEQASYNCPAYIRAVQRDMKDYLSKHSDRDIPVGYSAADVRSILMDTANYFQCDLKNASSSGADFIGLNSYSWCGNSDFYKSGYDVLTDDFANASLPVIFSEYGCNAVEPRYFTEVEALYSDEMSQAFSGGLVYEYTQEENDFGLVKIKDNGDAVLLSDFENLRNQFGKLDMDRISTSNKTQTSIQPVECTADLIKGDKFLDSFDLPARPEKVQEMIEHGCPFVKPGKLVDVSSKKIPQSVFDHNGREVTGIKLNVVEDGDSNNPDADVSASDTDKKSHGENDKDSVSDNKDDKDDKSEYKNNENEGKTDDTHGTNDDSDNDNSPTSTSDSSSASSSSNANANANGSVSDTSNDNANSDATSHSGDDTKYYDSNVPNAAGRILSSLSVGLLSGALVLVLLL